MKYISTSYAFNDVRGKNSPSGSHLKHNGHPILAAIATIVNLGKHLGLETYRCENCGHETKRPTVS